MYSRGSLKGSCLVHLAAVVGGIGANANHPAKFFYENAIMNLQVIHNAYLSNAEKIISIGTVSIYPENSPIPFKEKNIWNGYPQEDNAPYGIAKRIMHTHSLSYRKQYDFNSIMVILTNLYGPNDNFKEDTSHVIAALIRRFYEAKKNNEKEVTVWGDGNSTRDFCYIENVVQANIMAAVTENTKALNEVYNIAFNESTSLNDLFKIIIENLESMNIDYNLKPIYSDFRDGDVRHSLADISKAKELLAYDPQFSLRKGMGEAMTWYVNNIRNN